MAEHNTLTGSGLHEPKNIDAAGTVDAGKVLTPSASSAGVGVLRNLVETEINTKIAFVTEKFENIDTVANIYIPCAFAGTVTEMRSVIHSALATSDTILTAKINGTNMTGGALTIAFSGSAAGDIDSTSPSALNTVAVGDYIQVTSDTAGTGTVDATLMFTITRT